jgi:hypothetical protein
MKEQGLRIAVMVALVAALNGLSYAFDWGWTFY